MHAEPVQRSIPAVVREVTGVSCQVEGTGGGCEALVGQLEGGYTLVLVDNLSLPEWNSDDLSIGIYPPNTWGDSGESIVNVYDDEPLTPERLTQHLLTALGDLAVHARQARP